MKRYLLLVLIITVLSNVDVKGATIFGRVIEVNSGDVITIYNLNRPVRIRILGIDAPEMNQAFGEVARKHLSDLVYDKSVLVDYSGIASDSSLTGRVLLNNSDIGAQMIRDGAAWVDPSNQDRLSSTDREVYQLSQQAARSERRGLWQAENPIAPWEFVKAEALRKNPYASLKAILPEPKPKTKAPSELTNLTLMSGGSRSGSDDDWWNSTERKNWRVLRPEGEHFSVLVPEDGKIGEYRLELGELNINFKSFYARDGWSIYWIMWIDGSAVGETHETAISSIVEGFLNAVQKEAGKAGGAPVPYCEARSEKNISRLGYSGTEFDMSNCTLPMKARAFTKVKGNRRYMYFGAVMYAREEPNVSKFLQSFTIEDPAKSATR
jgi:endonuclease YncB( thermonuclease family)